MATEARRHGEDEEEKKENIIRPQSHGEDEERNNRKFEHRDTEKTRNIKKGRTG